MKTFIKVSSWKSYPDAKLHIFTTVYLHSAIKASDLSKEFAISNKDPHDGGAPEDRITHIKNLQWKEPCGWTFQCLSISKKFF